MSIFFLTFFITAFSIVIDPGHGGDDCGICLQNFSEKEITLRMAELLKDELIDFEVYLTREGDYSVPQEERVGYANGKGDLFISLHINSSFSNSLSGTIIYIPSVSPQNCDGIPLISWEMANACGMEETEKLAFHVKTEIEKFRNAVIERENLFVLMGLKIPGILVEAGFYNEKDFLSETFLKEFIKYLAYGIRIYIDERKKK